MARNATTQEAGLGGAALEQSNFPSPLPSLALAALGDSVTSTLREPGVAGTVSARDALHWDVFVLETGVCV